MTRHTQKEQSKKQTLTMGTEVDQRFGEHYRVPLWFYGIQSHVQPLLSEICGKYQVSKGMIYIQRDANRKAGTGSWNPAQAFYGPPTISVGRSLTEVSTHDPDWTMRRGAREGRRGKDKSVPVSVAKETMIYVAHTYCFFWACEARSLAFSLAASAVSLARSVAVSAKVLDGLSPAT